MERFINLSDWVLFYRRRAITVLPNVPLSEYDWDEHAPINGYVYPNSPFPLLVLILRLKDREEPYIFKVVTAALELLGLYGYPHVIHSKETGNVYILFRRNRDKIKIYRGPDREDFGKVSILWKGPFELPCYKFDDFVKSVNFYFKCLPACKIEYVDIDLMYRCVNSITDRFGVFLDKDNPR